MSNTANSLFAIEEVHTHHNPGNVGGDIATSATRFMAFSPTYIHAVNRIKHYVYNHNMVTHSTLPAFRKKYTESINAVHAGYTLSFIIREIPKKGHYTLFDYRKACENPLALYDESQVHHDVIMGV